MKLLSTAAPASVFVRFPQVASLQTTYFCAERAGEKACFAAYSGVHRVTARLNFEISMIILKDFPRNVFRKAILDRIMLKETSFVSPHLDGIL